MNANRVMALAGLSLLSLSEPLQTQTLQEKVEQAIVGFRGNAGVYIRHLRSGETASINADTLFPTASMIKVPILCAVFEKMDRGDLDYHATMTYTDSLLYAGEDILGSFSDSSTITLSKLIMLMISTSDNTASLWLQSLCGTGVFINEWLDAHGLKNTRMNSRTPGRRPNWEVYGWGQTTPREMSELLVMIRERRAVSPSADEEMFRVLSNVYWSGEALSQIPPDINVASKQGAVDASRSEVLLVNAPHGDYVLCVITKDNEDISWEYGNEGYVLIRKISSIVWDHFQPDYGWEPPAESQKWAK